jgi:uncharacterized membrane protein YoaK (UPF0700 family)
MSVDLSRAVYLTPYLSVFRSLALLLAYAVLITHPFSSPMTVTNVLHEKLPSGEDEKSSPFRTIHDHPPKTTRKKLFRLRTNTDADTVNGGNVATPAPQVPLPDRKKHHFAAISVGGTLLTINAGFINAVTALHSGMFTTHVSGNFTKAGMSLEALDGNAFLQYSMLICCFMFGSFLCSLLVPYQTFYLGRAYNLVFILGTFFLLLSSAIGISYPDSSAFAFFVAISSGMQNAMTTGYSGSVLRTTHMTGMTTDVGIILGKLAKGDRKDLWKLAMFLPMMTGFFIGGAMGAKAVSDLGIYALLMNVVLFAGTGLLYTFYLSVKHHIPFLTALFHNKDLKPRKKGIFVPKDENVDVAIAAAIAMENGEGFQELSTGGEYGDGFDIDDEEEEGGDGGEWGDGESKEDKEDELKECEVIDEEYEDGEPSGAGNTSNFELEFEEVEDEAVGHCPVKGSYQRV